MIYESRNLSNINKLADNTKRQTLKWYEEVKKNNIEILVYETIRSLDKQKENVKNGVSKTLKSYHLVGQAFDWVLVDKSGNALWNSYKTKDSLKVIDIAKKLGFESGHDWGWDSPHMQYNYKGYGTDTFGKAVGAVQTVVKENNTSDSVVKSIQATLNSKYGAKLNADGFYGDKTRAELLIALKKEFNKTYAKEMGRTIGTLDGKFYDALEALFSKAVLSQKVKTSKEIIYILQASLYVNGHKEVGTLDGVWGNDTTKAVNNYRKSKGFKEDGLVGGSTWRALLG